MALRRALGRRLFYTTNPDHASPITTVLHSPPSATTTRFIQRQRRAINDYSSTTFLTLPVGKKLSEKLQSMDVNRHQLPQLDGLRPPPEGFRVGPADAKKVLKFVQMEQIRDKLRNIPASTIPYTEFERICGDTCGNSVMGLEFAKALEQSGNVIVFSGVVFLRPHQVAKSMERLISESIEMPNDPRRKELENLENQKARIDEKARTLVRGELYCGLGFLVLQTLGFMRLTFWELSWDVMEPICFFVASLHFALAYAFFLRTSKEPSFEAYFKTRSELKQKKLMNTHNFDVQRYNHLRHVLCCPNNVMPSQYYVPIST